jgi:REP element-mobilizing transposase RayT
MLWGTWGRRALLPEVARKRMSGFLSEYARSKGLFMVINYVNADHAHVLVDLPSGMTVEQLAHLLKGASSHWINQSRLIQTRFAWGKGYGAFSVSQSMISKVSAYIANQQKHHEKKGFLAEYMRFIRAYELEYHGDEWDEDETVETVEDFGGGWLPPQ